MRARFTASLVTVFVLAACGGQSNLSSFGMALTSAPSGTTTRSALEGYREIVVSIDRVTAHSNSAGWVELANTPVTVDLLRLADYAEPLGFANLPAGRISQIRLHVVPEPAAYVTLRDGSQHSLKVPSGEQSGIKLKGKFRVGACEAALLTVDFQGHKSIWVHATGHKGVDPEYILRPVIKALRFEATPIEGCTPDQPAGGNGNPGGNGNHGGNDSPGDNDASFPGDPGGGGDWSDDGSQPGDGSGTEPGDGSYVPGDGSDGSGTQPGDGSYVPGDDPSGGDTSDPGTGGPGAACGTHSDCASGLFCGASDTCEAQFAPGAFCEIDAQCSVGLCANGICGGIP